MGVWNNLENGISGALNLALLKLSGQNLPFYDAQADWDSYETRLQRYAQNELYYNNTQYAAISKWGKLLRDAGALYVNTRGIYNIVFRLVNLYADKVYPATLDLDKLTTGAMPVKADDRIKKAIIRLMRWSNWNTEKQLYVRTGEKYGDVFLKVVDDLEGGRVVLEVLAPHKVRYMEKDTAGNIKEIWIQYRIKDDKPRIDGLAVLPAGTPNPPLSKTNGLVKSVLYTEIITEDSIKTYHDNLLQSDETNPYGFVPIVHAKPIDEGFMYGATHWAVVRSKIDEINSQAALLNDQTRKSVIPYIATIGGKIDAKDLQRPRSTMDEVVNIQVGVGGDVKAVTPTIDVAGALENIRAQVGELREDVPELFLHQLTQFSAPVSGVALRQFFDLAVNKIMGAQGVYDDALSRAIQMALTMGGVQGYTDFEGFNLESFDKGELDFTILRREVIYDDIPETTVVSFLLSSGAPQGEIWKRLGISDEDVELWKKELEEENDEMINAQLDKLKSIGGTYNTTRLQVGNTGVKDDSKAGKSALSTPDGA